MSEIDVRRMTGEQQLYCRCSQ